MKSSNIKKLFLFVGLMTIILCDLSCFKPLYYAEKIPDTVRVEAHRFLEKYGYNLTKVIEAIKLCNIQTPIEFSDRGRMWCGIEAIHDDGVLEDVTSKYSNLFNVIYERTNGFFDIYSDSILTRFSCSGGIGGNWLITSICYSECSFDDLKKYRYQTTVYTKDEIPDTLGAYFWEIEKNWYVFEPKFISRNFKYPTMKEQYQWAVDNKFKYFYSIYDTLSIFVEELNRIDFEADSIRIEEFEQWRVNKPAEKIYFLSKKTHLLDSLSVNNHKNIYYFYYTKKYIEVNLWFNSDLYYYYSELPQDSLQQFFSKKLHKIIDKWYYKDL